MTSLTESAARLPAIRQPRVRLEPVRFHHAMLDGRWCPYSRDPAVELSGLLPVLDRVRGPVVRVLLSAAGWATRPHQVRVGAREVSLGYFSDQPPALLTAICADGGTIALLVLPVKPPAGRPGDEDVWESEGGGLAPQRRSAW